MTLKTHMPMVGLALPLLVAAACGKSDEPMRAPAEPEVAEPAPAAPAEVAEEAEVVVVPVVEDYEAEVATTITADNYTAELDAIEAELDK